MGLCALVASRPALAVPPPLVSTVANADCVIVTDDEERETDDGIRILSAWKWLLLEERI